jgi:5'-nucleotidase/UDP-sugar diphosphatase
LRGVYRIIYSEPGSDLAVRRIDMLRRTRFNLTFLVIIASVIMAVAAISPAIAADAVEVTIFHVNDVHGRMDPFVPTGATEDVGALSKVAAYVAERRKAEGANIMLLSAGDMVHGTNIVNLFGGLPMIEVMNNMGFAAMTLGNHEFNYGQEQLLALEEAAKFPLTAANVVYEADGTNFVDAWAIIDIAGVKFGVFGLSPLETPIVTHPKNVLGLAFIDPVTVAEACVAALADKVDVIVCLSHLGYGPDKELAAAVKGIDIIVGGHSHTVVAAPEKVGDTIIVQAGEWAGNLGELKITVEDGDITSFSGGLIPITASMPASAPDSAVGTVLANYEKQLSEKLNVVVGSTPVALVGERADVRTRTTNLSNLVTDAMKDYTGADIVITNGGGIRASLPAGDITMGGVYTVLPFDNTLVVLELDGAGILKALEHGLKLYPEQNGAFSQVAGLTAKFDPAAPVGSRVLEVMVGDELLDLNKKYTVATNDFMAAGGDGYEWFMSAPVLFNAGDMLRDILANYLMARGQLAPSDVSSEPRLIPVK